MLMHTHKFTSKVTVDAKETYNLKPLTSRISVSNITDKKFKFILLKIEIFKNIRGNSGDGIYGWAIFRRILALLKIGFISDVPCLSGYDLLSGQ